MSSLERNGGGTVRGARRSLGGRPMLSPERPYKTRKAWEKRHHRMWIRNNIYSTWAQLKKGCTFWTDSAFAGHLLSLEMKRRERLKRAKKKMKTEESKKNTKKSRVEFEGTVEDEPLTSTPLGKPRRPLNPDFSFDGSNSGSSFVNVTGSECGDSVAKYCNLLEASYQVINDTVVIARDRDSEESDSSDSESSASSGLSKSIASALQILDEDLCDDDDNNDDDDDSDSWSDNDVQEVALDCAVEGDELDVSSHENSVLVNIPLSPDPQGKVPSTPALGPPNDSPFTSVKAPVPSTNLPPIPLATSVPPTDVLSTPIATPVLLTNVLQAPLATPIPPTDGPSAPVPPTSQPETPGNKRFSRAEEKANHKEELGFIKATKVICTLDLLIQEFASHCRQPGCLLKTTVDYSLVGTSATIRSSCPAGHKGRFCTSGYANGILANNLQTAASVLLSGNNFAKIEKFAKFLGLSFISASTFYRVQRVYCIRAIDEWWEWMRAQLITQFTDENLVLSGDGQCDSPGFSAKNLCYFLMELVSGYILEVEILDKRHVNMKSSCMEKQALKNALERIKRVLKIVEVCTDASSTIKKLLADEFKEIFHSLDIWHKATSIRKCLLKVSNIKHNKKIAEWSEEIINHFWYCCSVCMEGTMNDEEALQKMKDKWVGLLHHVCNCHEWTGGKCGHEELKEHPLPWFDRRDKDFQALQKVILEPTLLGSFKYYVRFRHTGDLECANSLSLAYAPKRCAYSFRAYKARKQLAAIDWNFHVGREQATNSKKEGMVSRKYNKRTKEWNSVIVKVGKSYEYVPVLMAKFSSCDCMTLSPLLSTLVSLKMILPEFRLQLPMLLQFIPRNYSLFVRQKLGLRNLLRLHDIFGCRYPKLLNFGTILCCI